MNHRLSYVGFIEQPGVVLALLEKLNLRPGDSGTLNIRRVRRKESITQQTGTAISFQIQCREVAAIGLEPMTFRM